MNLSPDAGSVESALDEFSRSIGDTALKRCGAIAISDDLAWRLISANRKVREQAQSVLKAALMRREAAVD
jgi:monoamine oxidase